MKPTPRCDALARELLRPTSGPFAGNDSHQIIDWIALAQQLERELAEQKRRASTAVINANLKAEKRLNAAEAYPKRLQDALERLVKDGECYCADHVATIGPCGHCEAREALANPGSAVTVQQREER